MVSFTDAIKTCLTKKFVTISGRATRAEFWWFQLFVFLVILFFIILSIALAENGGHVFFSIGMILCIILIIPNFCVQVRRLHDAGRSGWFLLWRLLPWIGDFVVLIVFLQGSDSDNEYGPIPTNIDIIGESVE